MIKCFLLATLLAVASAVIQVEHSFDGSTFSPAGKLSGDLLSDTELSWDRPELSVDEREVLEQAAEADGLYFVRVVTDNGALLSSVPAACLRIPDLAEQVELHATRDGALVAFNYDLPGCMGPRRLVGSGPGAGSEAEAGGSSGAVAQRPQRLAVQVLLPKSGPILTVPELVGEFMDVPVESVDLGAAAYDPNAKPRAAAPSPTAQGTRKGAPPPPDERTWLQKNWLFVVGGGMMVLNVLAKANAPPQGPAGGAAPGGAAGGARRG